MAFRVVVLVSGTGTLLQSLIDNLPEQAFFNTGNMDDVEKQAAELEKAN